MTDDAIGYRKPPKHSRFKPGNNANPKGRPKRKPTEVAEIIESVFDGFAEYRERGRTKTAKRGELTIRTHIRLALKGDLRSIETILLLRAHAQTSNDAGVQRLEVTDWLPDYPGQTGEQKTREFAAQASAETNAWWKDANIEKDIGK